MLAHPMSGSSAKCNAAGEQGNFQDIWNQAPSGREWHDILTPGYTKGYT